MKATEDLFDLIQSLSKTEKRYFKQHSKLHVIGERNSYLLLFDAIAAQKKYNEPQLLKRFQGANFVKRFAAAKYFLYRQVLKTLRSYHSSIHSQTRDLIHEAEILYEKGFFKQARKFIFKAKQTARKYEMHWAMPELFRMEEILFTQWDDNKSLNTLLEEKTTALTVQQNIQAYRDIYFRVAFLYFQYGKAREKKHLREMEKIVSCRLMLDESLADSSYSALQFHYTWHIYWHAAADMTKAAYHAEKSIEIFHKNPDLISINLMIYFANMSNLLSNVLMAKQYEKVQSLLASLQNAQRFAKTQIQKTRYYFDYNNPMLGYLNETGQFPKAAALIPAIAGEFEKHKERLSEIQKAVICATISQSYFGGRQYDKSIYWLNRVRNEINLNTYQDIQSFLPVFYLIVNYEAGKNSLLPYLIQSVYRFLKKKERLYKFEIVLIHFLRTALPKVNTRKELIQEFKKLKTKILEFEKDPYEKNAFLYFDYISWLESKIENRPFAEVVRQKA
ncbi:MAG: hypothetical protein EPN85_02135, partial [Bacteroidetes bacterium]